MRVCARDGERRRCSRTNAEGGLRTTLPHQLLGDAEPSVRAHHAQARDVAMLDPVRGVFLHLGQDVADDAGVVVGGFGRARDVDGDVGELWPGERVIEVVLHEIAERG